MKLSVVVCIATALLPRMAESGAHGISDREQVLTVPPPVETPVFTGVRAAKPGETKGIEQPGELRQGFAAEGFGKPTAQPVDDPRGFLPGDIPARGFAGGLPLRDVIALLGCGAENGDAGFFYGEHHED